MTMNAAGGSWTAAGNRDGGGTIQLRGLRKSFGQVRAVVPAARGDHVLLARTDGRAALLDGRPLARRKLHDRRPRRGLLRLGRRGERQRGEQRDDREPHDGQRSFLPDLTFRQPVKRELSLPSSTVQRK